MVSADIEDQRASKTEPENRYTPEFIMTEDEERTIISSKTEENKRKNER